MALSSGKIDQYEYLTGKEMLPSNQSQMTKQVHFQNLLWEKLPKKQIKSIGDQVKKTSQSYRAFFKPLNLSNKTNELKQLADIFPDKHLLI